MTKPVTNSNAGSSCDREYINILKEKASKLRSEIASAPLPVKDCSLCHMRNAANEIRNAVLELEKAYEMYGEKESYHTRRQTVENKQAFVVCLQAAFIAGDSERYARLKSNPVEYDFIGDFEYLMRDEVKVNVTGCSCAAIAEAFIQNFL